MIKGFYTVDKVCLISLSNMVARTIRSEFMVRFIVESGMFNWTVINTKALLDIVWPENLGQEERDESLDWK
jgi:hypothetical protein